MYKKHKSFSNSSIPAELWTRASLGLVLCVMASIKELLLPLGFSWQLLPDMCHDLCCPLRKDLGAQQVLHSVIHMNLSNRAAASPYKLSLQAITACKATNAMSLSEMFLFGSSLASFLQSLCFFIHTTWISLSFCFHLVPKATVLAKLFFTLPSFPSWHICPCGLTITFLRKCQSSLASFLSPLLWNLSSSSFLHLFILSHAVLADRL